MSNISEKVEKFADYFANIAMKLKSSVILMMNFVWRYNLTQPLHMHKMFNLSPITSTFVHKELQNLKRNKSCAADELPPNMLKYCAPAVIQPLTHIINLYFQTSTALSAWKLAKITPVFKAGDH